MSEEMRLRTYDSNSATFAARQLLVDGHKRELTEGAMSIAITKTKAKDLLYMHDTIELFSETLGDLQNLFRIAVAPKLHPRRVAELEGTANRLFGKVEDTIREAALIAAGRKLSPERLVETAQDGLKELFGRKPG